MSKIARLLGKLEDADTYLKLSDKIKDAFNRKFFEEDRYTGEKYSKLYKKIEALVPANAPEDKKKEMARELIAKFVAYSQTSNVLSLFLDMVPEDKEKAVVKNLVNDIVVTHSYHLNTGIIGTRYLFDVLTKYGRADLAYKIATQTTYPSWGYMIKEGATTIWERWEDLANAGMNSHNHIMFGTVDPFFYKVLAGINLDPSSPGFKQIIIKPYLIGDLKYVSASLKTIKGRVSSSWAKHETSLVLHVDIPCNVKAHETFQIMTQKECERIFCLI